MASIQAPHSITEQWVRTYLNTKYPTSSFNTPSPTQFQFNADIRFGSVPLEDAIKNVVGSGTDVGLIGVLDVFVKTTGDQYDINMSFLDILSGGSPGNTSVVIEDKNVNLNPQDPSLAHTKHYHFDCIELMSIASAFDMCSFISLVFNGYKITRN